MSRSLIFSNDELHVGLNEHGLVSTLYFPYVGSESHTPNLVHRIGVWVDGRIFWLDDGGWTHKARYPYSALIGHTVMVNEDAGILLEFEDFVDAEKNNLIRNIHIVNLRPEQRSVRIFMHQAFVIGNNFAPDTVQYLPKDKAILHYEGRRAFVVGGMTDVGQAMDQHSVGLFGNGRDGTWRDADDGELSGSNSSCGKVDSTMRFSLTIGGLSSRRVHYWLSAGNSIRSAIALHNELRKSGVNKRLEATTSWWRKWLAPSLKITERLGPKYRQPFTQSLMLIRAHIDQRGAIIAKSDRLGEAYCLPRDAAYSVWPLMRLGYKEEVLRFFAFCKDAMTDDGYLMSKYHANGAIGDSRHPYDDEVAPIQSDETALVVFLFAQFKEINKQLKSLDDYYRDMIVPMANFLSKFTDEHGLPRASYDFNNEKKSTTTYTIAVTYAALLAAADLADSVKDQDSSVQWRSAAEDMRLAFLQHVASEDRPLPKALHDSSPDIASIFGVFMFGLIDFESDAVKRAVRQVEEDLRRSDGLFTGDQSSTEADAVTSLWMAQYYMESDRRSEAEEIISHIMAKSGLGLGNTGETRKTWEYAEFVSTLLDTLTKK